MNLSNAAVKVRMDAVVDVHAKKLAGNALSYAAAVQWRQFTNFLWGKIFYGIGKNFFAPSCQKPHISTPMKSIHVLKCTKA